MTADRRSLRDWAFLAACCWAMMSVSLINAGHALLLSRLAGEFGWSEAVGGTFLSAMFWGFAGTLLIAGTIVDRLGYGLPFLLGVGLQFAGGTIISRASGLHAAIGGAVLANVGNGLIMAVGVPVGCQLFPKRRTAVCGVLSSFSSIGAMTVGLLGLALIDTVFGWRAMSGLYAALTLPPAAAFFLAPARQAGPAAVRRLPVHLLRSSAYLRLLATVFLMAMVSLGVSLWEPSYVAQLTGGGLRGGALGMVLFATAGSAMYVLVGPLAAWIGSPLTAGLGAGLAVVSLLFASLATSPGWAVLGYTLFGLGVCTIGPVALGQAGDRFPKEGASLYSLMNAAGNLGGVTGPFLLGHIAVASSQAWALRTCCVLVAGALAFLLSVVGLRARRTPGPERQEGAVHEPARSSTPTAP